MNKKNTSRKKHYFIRVEICRNHLKYKQRSKRSDSFAESTTNIVSVYDYIHLVLKLTCSYCLSLFTWR